MPLLEPSTNEETLRRARDERAAKAAFQALKENSDFDVAWQWMQRRFPLLGPSFTVGNEGNTHAAAIRDGEKNVMRFIQTFLSLTPEEAEADDRPTQAVTNIPPTNTPQ